MLKILSRLLGNCIAHQQNSRVILSRQNCTAESIGKVQSSSHIHTQSFRLKVLGNINTGAVSVITLQSNGCRQLWELLIADNGPAANNDGFFHSQILQSLGSFCRQDVSTGKQNWHSGLGSVGSYRQCVGEVLTVNQGCSFCTLRCHLLTYQHCCLKAIVTGDAIH